MWLKPEQLQQFATCCLTSLAMLEVVGAKFEISGRSFGISISRFKHQSEKSWHFTDKSMFVEALPLGIIDMDIINGLAQKISLTIEKVCINYMVPFCDAYTRI